MASLTNIFAVLAVYTRIAASIDRQKYPILRDLAPFAVYEPLIESGRPWVVLSDIYMS